MAVTPFPDSPRNGAWGDRPYAIIDFAGSASYTQVTTGTPPTGGQAINPSNFGLTAGLEGIFMVGASTNGQYGVVAMQATAYNQGTNNPTWILLWYVIHTGAEVAGAVNLSAQTVRLVGFGPY
jgi:hypothetical protein